MRSAPTLKIWITPFSSVAMLEKLALLKIASWSAPVLIFSSRAREDVMADPARTTGHGTGARLRLSGRAKTGICRQWGREGGASRRCRSRCRQRHGPRSRRLRRSLFYQRPADQRSGTTLTVGHVPSRGRYRTTSRSPAGRFSRGHTASRRSTGHMEEAMETRVREIRGVAPGIPGTPEPVTRSA